MKIAFAFFIAVCWLSTLTTAYIYGKTEAQEKCNTFTLTLPQVTPSVGD